MRYSFITPTEPLVARELRAVISNHDARASERLRAAEKVAAARRASAHSLKIVTRTLASADLSWERFVHLVGDFHR